MSIEIPESRREEEELHQHEEQQERHEKTIMEHERHPEDGKAYHDMKEAKAAVDARIGHDEKAGRRQQDEKDAAIAEEYDTEFRNE